MRQTSNLAEQPGIIAPPEGVIAKTFGEVKDIRVKVMVRPSARSGPRIASLSNMPPSSSSSGRRALMRRRRCLQIRPTPIACQWNGLECARLRRWGSASVMDCPGAGEAPYDWLVIGEFPDDKTAASAVLAAAAGGSRSDVETTVAMTAKDAAATFEACRKGGESLQKRGTLTSLRCPIRDLAHTTAGAPTGR